LEVTDEGEELETGTPPLDRIFVSAFATNIKYEFTEFTRLEIKGVIDLYQGDDYYVQPQVAHAVNDNLTVIVGFDILGGPRDTFLGQFKDNNRAFAKLIYTF
jgi:hypothetical protein